MRFAILIARLCAAILRLFKKGATTLPGRTALFLKYDILTRLARGVRVVCVTGTNGKTTTCALLAHALEEAGCSCFLNRSGANMLSGVTTAFIMNSDWRGRCQKDFAVLECDENSLPLIARYLDAEVICVTNLFRDQLDRYGEITATLSKIQTAIERTPRATLVLNADDPLTASLGARCKNKAVTFGVDGSFSDGGMAESRYCPLCHAELIYTSRVFSQLGVYRCPVCAFRRRTPDYCVSEVGETGFLLNGEPAASALGGLYNLYNFCAAAAVLGVLKAGDTEALCRFSGAFGRMERFSLGGRTALLLLVKNPAGLSACIRYVSRIQTPFDAAFALNDNDADGRDISWVWDSDFTPLLSCVRNVFALGTRAEDMALRLKYDGIFCREILSGEDYRALLERIRGSEGDFVIFSTYTAMMKMRHLLIDAFGGREFWE